MSAARQLLDWTDPDSAKEESPEPAPAQERGTEGVDDLDGRDQLASSSELVEVRRSAAVCATVGLLSAALAIAWLQRAVGSGSLVDWAWTLALAVLATFWLRALLDSRTPVLVGDAQGLRLRLGGSWLGLPWTAIERIEHRPRQGLRDGRLVVQARQHEALLADVDRAGQRQAKLASRWYGGPLALPLGFTTRIVGASNGDLGLRLGQLGQAAAELIVIVPEQPVQPTQAELEEPTPADEVAEEDHAEVDEPRVRRDPRPALASALTRLAGWLPARPIDVPEGDGAGAQHSAAEAAELSPKDTADHSPPSEPEDSSVDSPVATEPVTDTLQASPSPEPHRLAVPPARAEVHLSAPDLTANEVDGPVLAEPTARPIARPEPTAHRNVRPIARPGHPVPALELADHAAQPADEPVIGPELRAARTRLGLGVSELAERTRIRSHVIEAIEVDDFVPCGGDFYARGHLRTLARVLGVDVTPHLETFDARYAHAPIDARLVFEAELASGVHGSLRSARGGPNWSILVAAVMALVLCWSIARLVMDAPPELRLPEPVLNGSGGPNRAAAAAADPIPVTITAGQVGARVVVRDAVGAVVFTGNLAIGETRTLKAAPPVRIQSSDGSLTVAIGGQSRGLIGERGEAVQRTYAAGAKP